MRQVVSQIPPGCDYQKYFRVNEYRLFSSFDSKHSRVLIAASAGRSYLSAAL
jgi:mRNA-degrading endonuclease RelE of RelBE toxin-antitoxin system